MPDSNVEGAWAAKCLEAATGKPYTFDISTKSFSAKTDEEIRAENEERKRISEEAEARKREQERRDAELLKAHGDEERRLECSLTLAEKNLRTAEYRVNAAKGQRSRETEKMVQTTCEKLYRRDRREAILNPICLSVFREFGLPDSSVEINATRDELLDARLQVLQARRQLQEFRGYKLESSITSENEVGDCEYLLNTDE
ncbi:hypothetical protein [Marinovum sp.]|uniref:hypothetical protein n=1 Tax=Marinovum sp. TaxID=2024839 RepID=UPI002B275C80|nr:hypothetical protein [Marinovum sp.]